MMNEAHKKAQATRERNQEARARRYEEQAANIRAARLARLRVMGGRHPPPKSWRRRGCWRSMGNECRRMKITISYTAAEEKEATAILAVLRPLLPGVRVHKNVSKPPFIHLYLTTKKPQKR